MGDTTKRSLIKTISWRLTGSGATFIIAFLVGGSFSAAGMIAIVQLVTNTILYYIHERLWNNIGWGRV